MASIDVDALAAAIADNALQRASQAVVLTADHLREDGRELNQLQHVHLVYTALRCFDGTESAIRHELEQAIEPPLRFKAVA